MPVTPTKFSILGVSLSVLAIVASSLMGTDQAEAKAMNVEQAGAVVDVEFQVTKVQQGLPMVVEVRGEVIQKSC